MKKIIAIVLVAMATVGLGITAAPEAQAQPVYGAYCCDGFGVRRCVLPAYGPIGLACYCNGIPGVGSVCQ